MTKPDYIELARNAGAALATNQRFQTRSIDNGGFTRGANFSEFSSDSKHSTAWGDYGYRNTLSFPYYYFMYRRMGIANAVVNIAVDESWQTPPRITDDPKSKEPTAWENKFNDFAERVGLWNALKGLDERQRVGQYGGLFMEIRDGQHPSKPVRKIKSEYALHKLKPMYESQLEPQIFETDVKSPKYGEVLSWNLLENNVGDRNDETGRSELVNPERVVIWAEGADDDSIYGVSSLKAVFNSLVTLEKIIGAGGEGFYKNARGSQHINFDSTADIATIMQMIGVTQASEIGERMGEVVRSFNDGFDSVLVTAGIERNTVSIDLADPKPHFDNAMADVAAGAKYPLTIMIGQQTGRLASDEDQTQLAKMVTSRRNNFITPNLKCVIDRFIELGFLEKADYDIEWDDLFEPSLKEKLENLKLMAESAEILSRSTGETIKPDAMMAFLNLDIEVSDDMMSEELESEAEQANNSEFGDW